MQSYMEPYGEWRGLGVIPMIDYHRPEERKIVESYVRRFCVPLFQVRDDVPLANATGTLIRVADRTLLVTAAHFVREREDADIYAAIDGELAEPVEGRCEAGLEIDVAVIELNAEAAGRLGAHYDVLQLRDVSVPPVSVHETVRARPYAALFAREGAGEARSGADQAGPSGARVCSLAGEEELG